MDEGHDCTCAACRWIARLDRLEDRYRRLSRNTLAVGLLLLTFATLCLVEMWLGDYSWAASVAEWLVRKMM